MANTNTWLTVHTLLKLLQTAKDQIADHEIRIKQLEAEANNPYVKPHHHQPHQKPPTPTRKENI